jgi:hypothetical protein
VLKVSINSRKGFSLVQIAKHDQACRLLEYVLNSVEFYEELMKREMEWRYRKVDGSLINYTNKELYDLIMTGSDQFNVEPDGDIDVSVELYYKNNKVIGYTNDRTIWTWLNEKFFNSFSLAEIAMNLIHEYLHKLGFDHRNAKHHSSVPYSIGYLVRDLIKSVEKGRVLSPFIIGNNGYIPPKILIEPKKYVCRRSWRTLFRKVCKYE